MSTKLLMVCMCCLGLSFMMGCEDKKQTAPKPSANAAKTPTKKTTKPQASKDTAPPKKNGPLIESCHFPVGHCFEWRYKKPPAISKSMECKMKRAEYSPGPCSKKAVARCDDKTGFTSRFYYPNHKDAKPNPTNKNKAWGKIKNRCENIFKHTFKML